MQNFQTLRLVREFETQSDITNETYIKPTSVLIFLTWGLLKLTNNTNMVHTNLWGNDMHVLVFKNEKNQVPTTLENFS